MIQTFADVLTVGGLLMGYTAVAVVASVVFKAAQLEWQERRRGR